MGENPEQILGSVTHFTTKIKAQAFVNAFNKFKY